jgi:hypothetical protein
VPAWLLTHLPAYPLPLRQLSCGLHFRGHEAVEVFPPTFPFVVHFPGGHTDGDGTKSSFSVRLLLEGVSHDLGWHGIEMEKGRHGWGVRQSRIKH